MKYLNLLLISFLLIGCANKSTIKQNTQYKLNFINSSKYDIRNITLYSIKTDKKLFFNFIPKGAQSSFYFYKNIQRDNTILLSWQYKNKTYKHKFFIKRKTNKMFVNFNFYDDGKYFITII